MIEGTGNFNSQYFSQVREASLHHPGPGMVLFNRIDQNDSGGLDFDEVQALVDKTGRGSKLLENFDRVDKDGSGEISFRELKAFKHHRVAQNLFDKVDQNDSGGLDVDELQALVDRTGRGGKVLENFAEIDKDESGELNLREIKSNFKDIDFTA